MFVSGSFAENLFLLVAIQKGIASYFWCLEDVFLVFALLGEVMGGIALASFWLVGDVRWQLFATARDIGKSCLIFIGFYVLEDVLEQFLGDRERFSYVV